MRGRSPINNGSVSQRSRIKTEQKDSRQTCKIALHVLDRHNCYFIYYFLINYISKGGNPQAFLTTPSASQAIGQTRGHTALFPFLEQDRPMPKYQTTGRPAGRPRAYAPGDASGKLSIRVSQQLLVALHATAKAQRATVTALVVQALRQHLQTPTCSSHLESIDHSLTAAVKALGALEAALSSDDPRSQHLDAAFHALGDIDAALNYLLRKDLADENQS
jgi:hypothetical protein